MTRPWAVCALIATLLLPRVSDAAEVIKLGTLAPEGTPWYDILREMADEWKEISGGEIEVRIYASGIAGDETDIIRKMRIGQLHAGMLSSGGLSDIVPEFRALYLPMLFTSYEELDYVLDRKRDSLEALLEEKGFKVLNWGDAGWIRFFSQAPVVTPDDLKTQRLFWWEAGGAYIDAWKDAGFQPVPLAATEIHLGLQSGLINALAAPPIAALSFQWFPLAPNMTDLNWAPLIGATVVTTRSWRRLPEKWRPALLEASRAAGRRMLSRVRSLDGEAIEAMKRYGLRVHKVPVEIVDEWRERALAAYPKIIGTKVPPDMVEDVTRLRDAYHQSQSSE